MLASNNNKVKYRKRESHELLLNDNYTVVITMTDQGQLEI